jgi:hypothetical protein
MDLAPSPARRYEPMVRTPPQQHTAEGHEVRERLRTPLAILLAALMVATVEITYQKATGETLSIGPVRPFWIAAPLAVFGVCFTLWRLMEDRSDE